MKKKNNKNKKNNRSGSKKKITQDYIKRKGFIYWFLWWGFLEHDMAYVLFSSFHKGWSYSLPVFP